MITPGTSPTSGVPRSTHAQLPRKRDMIVAAILLLATAFVLTSVSTATAAPALTNNHVTSISNLTSAPCQGDKPRNCPD